VCDPVLVDFAKPEHAPHVDSLPHVHTAAIPMALRFSLPVQSASFPISSFPYRFTEI
jgi:hypothetical protein